MSGDYSRLSFDPRRDFAAVLTQQGRVSTDADANEASAEARRRTQTEALDTGGISGVPSSTTNGFLIEAATGKITIGVGRMYVDGLLAENHGGEPTDWEPRLAELPGTAAIDYEKQPYYPNPAKPPGGAGPHVAYLKVWQREVTAIEDPLLIEPALGVDTTTRLQTVWQVKLIADAGNTVTCATPLESISKFLEAEPGAGGRLSTRTVDVPGQPDPCTIPPGGGYKGSENQFYRVEIHRTGKVGAGGARFKWSRDNATVATRVTHIHNLNELVVESIGRDAELSFSNGDWVEVTDDWLELNGLPGEMRRIRNDNGVDEATRTITLDSALPAGTFPVDAQGGPAAGRNTRLRRWDQRGRVLNAAGNLHFDLESSAEGTIPVTNASIQLEHGVVVDFTQVVADGVLRSGDWWCFAARAATGTVEELEKAPANGIHAHYTKLALVSFPDNQTDCRTIFDPLTDRISLFYVSGDTQQALPDVGNPAALVPLPRDLAVGVANGGRPVAGARVRFQAAQGRLANSGLDVTVTTDAAGLAAIKWELNSTDPVQTAVATLLRPDGSTRGLPVHFSATLALADLVAYKPDKCANLAGTTTVQEAIDRLCGIGGSGCDTLALSPGAGWVEALEQLPAGSDATVCFKPGIFETNRPVNIKGLRHLRLKGAGPSTRIVGRGAEATLVFEGCTSVHLSNLAVEVATFPADPVPGLMGTITARDCSSVDLDKVRIVCPNGTVQRGTCLTVRSGGGDADAQSVKSSELVRVRDCEFVVGHSQIGVLVVNSERVAVSGSDFRTPALPANLGIATLLTDRLRLSRAVDQLAGKLVVDLKQEALKADFNTALRVGGYVVRLNSPVPEAEWQAMVKSNPPTDTQAASSEALAGYVEDLVGKAAADTSKLPSFNRLVGGLSGRLSNASRFFGSEEGKTSIRSFLAGAVDVKTDAETAAIARSVNLNTSSGTVRFDSPLPQASWSKALKAMPSDDQSATGIAKQIKAVAKRILQDSAFAKDYAPDYMEAVSATNVAAASCGVRVAGTVVGDVTVDGNRFTSTIEGVHVAAAFRPTSRPTRRVRSVRIRDNDISISVPFELDHSPRAVFVGNSERILVNGNRSRLMNKWGVSGIHLEGEFGFHLAVRDNLVEGCETGVVVSHHGGTPDPSLWLVRDNVATGAANSVVASGPTRVEGNVP